ncbi:peptidase inhibitor family I36 protein [Streptomyces sp. NPDC005899]|uniref:peptidase inhibitor family I36 protein n=1 Tax=Streptomyces sp. NPDC005899 TaxID=3155716 RepID=UPI0033F3A191
MNRITALAAALVTLAFGLGTGAASAAPAASFSCSSGNFCAYSDWNGGGTRCQWPDERKANTADNCSFIQRGENVRSVWNATGHRVQYYTQTNYNARVGSTPSGQGGNLQGNYQIRSFKPQ